jgi:hypothetical protein
MSGKVISLTGEPIRTAATDQLCIDTLRDILALAESGEITGVCIAGQSPDGATVVARGGYRHNRIMAGTLFEMATKEVRGE